MALNPILEEIYAARNKLLADCKGDVHAYVQGARQRALASGRIIVAPKKRPKAGKGSGLDLRPWNKSRPDPCAP